MKSVNTSKKFRHTALKTAVGLALAQAALSASAIDLYARIDGLGSLVDPRSGGSCSSIGGFGCWRDEVNLYGGGDRSAALFQVLRDPSTCTSVQLTGLPSGGATIMVKSWNERFPGDRGHTYSRSYVTTGSNPVIPTIPNTDWTTIAVMSNSVLSPGSYYTVRATCTTSTFQSNVLVATNSDGSNTLYKLVDISAEYSNWTGNGSLITASYNTSVGDTAAGYGRYQDVVGLHGDAVYSAQYFQVYNNGSCNNVRISSSLAGTRAYTIKSKAWDGVNWTTRYSPNNMPTLPITIATNSGGSFGGYYVFQVQPLDSSSRAQISVTCQ